MGDEEEAPRASGEPQEEAPPESKTVSLPDQSGCPKFKQLIAALAAAVSTLTVGTVLGWTNPAIPSMKRSGEPWLESMTEFEVSWIGSLMPLGGLVGSLSGGYLVEALGRKKTIMFVCSPGFIGTWLLIGFAQWTYMIMAGRFLNGLIVGLSLLCCPTYISEIATFAMRGTFGAFTQLMIVFGILLVYLLGAVLSWRPLCYGMGAGLGVIMGLVMIPMPESPVWLIRKGKTSAARTALTWLRGDNYDVEGEIAYIKQETGSGDGEEESATWGELFIPINLVPFLVAVMLQFNQQTSGINVVIFYSNAIFEAAGGFDPFLSTIIIGVVQVFATLVATGLVEKAGRRLLLIASSGLMLLSMGALTMYFMMEATMKEAGMSVIPFGAVCLYIAAFSLGYGPVPWILSTEILAQKIKARVASVAFGSNWCLAFIITWAFPPLQSRLGSGGSFLVFTILCALGFVTTLLFVPETKMKTLPEVNQFFYKRCGCCYKEKPAPAAAQDAPPAAAAADEAADAAEDEAK